MIKLNDKNRELLFRVLRGGMSGSYYEHNEMPILKCNDEILNKTLEEISEEDAEHIAEYYSLYLSDLLEIIDDEKECEKWLSSRSVPFDDPW